VAAQDRLEVVLVAGGCGRGAELGRAGPRHAEELQLRIGEVLAACDLAGLLVAGRVRADLVLDPEAAIDLHRARRDAGELVLHGRRRVALDHGAAHPVVREQERGGQSVEAAADDEDLGVIALGRHGWSFVK